MTTRLRQIADRLLHGLLVVPLAFVFGAIVLGLVMVRVDGQYSADDLPRQLETTVEGARAILTAIAGGLLTSVTLLLSLLLVAVQLASSQFSPRTVRDWTGDRTQQVVIGLVLGTFVYCLMVLRETKTYNEGEATTEVIPHLSVLLAVVLGVVSLIGVLRAVDRLTTSLQITDVARSITADTRTLIRAEDEIGPIGDPLVNPAAAPTPRADADLTAEAVALDDHDGGWLQQIDTDALLAAVPADTTIAMAASLGSYAMPGTPLAWISPPPGDDALAACRSAVALGPERTMQQDVGFGIVQLVDIALRALSPGVNDPNTANDVAVHLGSILLELWSRPTCPTERVQDSKRFVIRPFDHEDYLRAALIPLLRHGAGEADVVATILMLLDTIAIETERRELPGPIEPLRRMADELLDAFGRQDHLTSDRQRIEGLGRRVRTTTS